MCLVHSNSANGYDLKYLGSRVRDASSDLRASDSFSSSQGRSETMRSWGACFGIVFGIFKTLIPSYKGLMRGRGHSPAASGVCLVGRSRTRPRLYRRSRRAGSKPPASTDLCMTAESTARPYPTQHKHVLMTPLCYSTNISTVPPCVTVLILVL